MWIDVSTVVRALGLAALLTIVPVGIGVTVAGDRTPEREKASYDALDLADFDTTTAVVQRAPFCDLVPEEAVKAALGSDAKVTAYGNGEESGALPSGDVAHEYGCIYAGDGAEARAWVFAPPVAATRATALVEAATAGKGCTAPADAPAYGTPSTALVCITGDRRTISYRGLFGDAWLACTLTVGVATDQADQVSRAGRWCVAVAEAASVLPS